MHNWSTRARRSLQQRQQRARGPARPGSTGRSERRPVDDDLSSHESFSSEDEATHERHHHHARHHHLLGGGQGEKPASVRPERRRSATLSVKHGAPHGQAMLQAAGAPRQAHPDDDALPRVDANAKYQPAHQTSWGISGLDFGPGGAPGEHHRIKWTAAEHIHSINVLGGRDLDLRGATFAHKFTYVTVFGLMGGCSIILPPGVDAVVTGCGILGEFRSPTGDAGDCMRREAPVVHITGCFLCGEVNVVYAAKGDHVEHHEMCGCC